MRYLNTPILLMVICFCAVAQQAFAQNKGRSNYMKEERLWIERDARQREVKREIERYHEFQKREAERNKEQQRNSRLGRIGDRYEKATVRPIISKDRIGVEFQKKFK